MSKNNHQKSNVNRHHIALLLHNLQSPINIGMILRVAETYKVKVAIFSSQNILSDEDKMKTVGDFSCGALERVGFDKLESDTDLEKYATGRRLIATSIDKNSTPLSGFEFQEGDVVLLGNEYDGLPQSILQQCVASIHIPMEDVWAPKPRSYSPIDPDRTEPVAHDGQPNLNVAITGAIVCYESHIRKLQADTDRSSHENDKRMLKRG